MNTKTLYGPPASLTDAGRLLTAAAAVEKRVRLTARRILRCEHMAEDVVQQTYVRCMTHYTSVDAETAEGWVATVGRRIALNAYFARQVRSAEPVEACDATEGREADPVEQVVVSEQRQQLYRTIDGLPVDLATVIRERLAGRTYAQIAESTGRPLGTVLYRGQRAEKLLAEQLQ